MPTPLQIEQLAALDAAISSGVRSVTNGGQTVTFNTTASLLEARQALFLQMYPPSGERSTRQTYGVHAGRGF